jgi:magnesium transporter
MLKIYPSDFSAVQTWAPGSVKSDTVIWIDLINPTADERRAAEELMEISLPTREETSAIEISSRLAATETALRVNIPSYVRTEGEHGPSTPLGFVLTPTRLATIRYAESLAFDHISDCSTHDRQPKNSTETFSALIESIVDVAADRIESLAADVSKLSQSVFLDEGKQRPPLKKALLNVGRMQRQITQIRSALLGVSRVVIFLCDSAPSWISKSAHTRFLTANADIGSLNEFDQQLSERLQFLLDAVLGLINNDQNDIMRVLTIVSVATVPPMILAGIWGMNFKSIPEYNWEHGYAFALTMIVLSMLIPLVIFRAKKWL